MGGKSTKGALLKGVLEKVPADSLLVITEAIQRTMHGKSGVYALYKGKNVYYVGLARSLRGRISWHTRDRHKGKWDNFSVFIIEKSKYLKDIETLILRVSQPDGNRTKGRIPHHNKLKRILEKEIRERTRKLNQLKRAFRKG